MRPSISSLREVSGYTRSSRWSGREGVYRGVLAWPTTQKMSALTRGVPLVVARYRDRSPVVAAALPLTAHAVRRGLTVATRTRTGSRSVGVLTTRRRALVVRASVDEATPAPKRTDTVHWSTALATAVAIAGAASPLVRYPNAAQRS